jgi:hypothetical protein
MRLKVPLAAATALAFAGCAPDVDVVSHSSTSKVEPVLVEGNPTCPDVLPGTTEFKIDAPPLGSTTHTIVDGVTVTIETDGTFLAFESSIGMDGVIMKGGNNANLYVYDPPETDDAGLVSPDNPSGGPAALSHVSFCYRMAVVVGKTAQTAFKRTHTWDITKDGDETELLMNPGQHHQVDYTVVLSETSADSDFEVSGEITVSNPWPTAATIVSVTDELFGSSIAVDCGVSFPHELGQGETLTCSYSASLAGAEDGTNVATVETAGEVEGGSATAEVSFASADIEVIDECVKVDDSLVGELGTVCAGDENKTFEYDYIVSPTSEHCEGLTVVNTASFVACDSGASGSDSHTVEVDVDCPDGCTLTQGYWKTHSTYGPAKKADETWEKLDDGPDTDFFSSGQSYFEVLWTAPRGNAYYNLAHQYIAAELNKLAGANFAGAQEAFDAATALFETYTPAEIADMKGRNASAIRGEFVALAAILDDYNNGLLGTAHCSEK